MGTRPQHLEAKKEEPDFPWVPKPRALYDVNYIDGRRAYFELRQYYCIF